MPQKFCKTLKDIHTVYCISNFAQMHLYVQPDLYFGCCNGTRTQNSLKAPEKIPIFFDGYEVGSSISLLYGI